MILRTGFIFLFSFLSFQAAARSLNLNTLSEKTREDIKKQIPALFEDNFTKSDLDQLVRYLVTQEQFDNVNITSEGSGNNEVFTLQLGKIRRISEIKFLGLDAITEPDARRQFSISEKNQFDQDALIEAGERVRQMYNERGFPNTVVNLEFTSISAVDVAVKVTVIEGLQTKVSETVVNTDNKELQELTQRFLKKYVGDPFTESLLSDIRKNSREFFSKKRFFKAELTGPEVIYSANEASVKLIFAIEKTEQYFLNFTGNKEMTSSSLEQALELDNFYSANPNIGPELANKIKNLYLARGYARVEVRNEEVDASVPNSRRISFDIREGPKIKIKNIEFVGSFVAPQTEFVEFIKQHSSDLIASGYYNRDDLDLGLNNLIIDLQNKGYLKAKRISYRTFYNDKRDQISIIVTLDQGTLTTLEKITFEGSTIDVNTLLGVVALRNNEPLRLNILEDSIQKLKDYYRNSGYLEMSLLNEREELVLYNEDNSKAHVNFKIYEGPKVVVGSILIEGNSITKDYVILKELEFKVGDTLTPALMEESISRLQRLGFFNTIDIRTLEEKTQISQRTVIVHVIDRDPGLLNFGVGANNERGLTLRGYTGVGYRNIYGTGRGVSARAEGNYNVSEIKYLETKITLGYLEPYILDTRTRGRINLTRARAVTDYDKRIVTEINQTTYTLEQDLTSHILISYDVLNLAQFRKFGLDANKFDKSSETTIASTGPTLDLDFRDHPFNPTKGTFTRFNLEYGSPALGSTETIDFLRGNAAFTHYQMMNRKRNWIWANSVRGGYLRNLSTLTNGGVPYDLKGMTLGGQSTIRGFTASEAFPNNQYDFADKPNFDFSQERYLLKNEARMFLFKSEFRFPIWGNFAGALFYDGGAVWVSDIDINDPYRDAAGIAFRYNTPVGAASFEFGYKLDRKEDKPPHGRDEANEVVFHLSIGTF